MAWTAPRTWVAGEVVTAAFGNTHWRDNLRYLKGLDGTVTLSDGLDLGANELTINSIEIVGIDGEINKAALEQLDHGADLAGLGDDDHTQYALRTILTTRGDIIYRNATVWARLAGGTEGRFLKMGANDPEWAAGILGFTELAGGEDHLVSSINTWEDYDLSGIIGAGAVSALVSIFHQSGGGTYACGARKNGSGLDRKSTFLEFKSVELLTECDASRIIEIIAGDTAKITFNILGYWS